MRKILFKGYLVDEGGWVTGEYHRYTSEMVVAMCDYAYSAFKVIPESVGQYIGVKDKHGNYIFEGDIVKICAVGHSSIKCIGVVGFKDGHYGIEFDSPCSEGGKGFHKIEVRPQQCSEDFCKGIAWSYEIIGNVFENPELLKEASK